MEKKREKASSAYKLGGGGGKRNRGVETILK